MSAHPAAAGTRHETPVWVVLLAVPFFAASVLFALLGGLSGVSVIDAVNAGRDANQSIPLGPGGTVTINATAGAVTVLPGPDGQVSVRDSISVRSPTQAFARQALDTFHRSTLTAEPGGASVDIPGEDFSIFAFNYRRLETVRVPAGAAVSITGDAVAADIHDLTGPIEVRVTSGAIRLKGVTVNGADSVTTTAGAIDFEGRLASGSLDLETHSGAINVSLPAGTNGSYDVANAGGALFVSTGHGAPHASAGSDNTATGIFGDGTGAALRVRATSGAISVRVA